MALTILSSGVRVLALAPSAPRNIFVLQHPQIIRRFIAVLGITVPQDPKFLLRCLADRARFALFRWEGHLTIVLLALPVIFVPRLQCYPPFAQLATFVLLLLICHLPALWVRLEILPR